MDNKKQIGWLTIGEREEKTLYYEYAAWYKKLILDSGRFPIYAKTYTDIERNKLFVEDTSVLACVQGTVIGDDFSSGFGGVRYDSILDKHLGEKDTWHYTPYAHALARGLFEKEVKNVELLENFEVEECRFLSILDGKEIVTYKIKEIVEKENS